jgi:uncharacterized protein YndB with AHSA1/START domain
MASTTVEISRPPDEVFAFVTDPAKLSAWQDAEEVVQLTEGPVRAGTRFREVHKAMGRRRVELTEVVEYDPGRLFHIRVVEGPPIDGRWVFAPTPALALVPEHRSGQQSARSSAAQSIGPSVRREHELDRQLEQRPESFEDLLPGDAPAQPLVQREARSEVGERVARDDRADTLDPQDEALVLEARVRLDPDRKPVAGRVPVCISAAGAMQIRGSTMKLDSVLSS